jgi:YfiH family protein
MIPLPVLRSTALLREGFEHAFTTRLGGVSEPPFDSLDFALLREPSALRENQARLAATLGIANDALFQAHQVHGATLLVAEGRAAELLTQHADALAAEPGSGHAVAVRVADCAPVLLGDPVTGRVVAVHAGWRGVEAGIVRVAVNHLLSRGARADARDYVAAIGPCIGACCFEVGLDVARRIADASSKGAVTRRSGDKAYVDLRAAIRAQLDLLGLRSERIDDVPGPGQEGCTRCDRARFYSFRRDGDESGRLVGAVIAR